MKKLLLAGILAGSLSTPVLADGYYKKSSKHDHWKHGDTCDSGCAVAKGLKFIVKLPFRIVTSTGAGVYHLLAGNGFDGFEKGYEVI